MIELKQRRSPNFGPRAEGAAIDMIVLHYTGMPDGVAALSWLANPASQVSSHYVVFEDGQVYQLVEDMQRAWHAGVSFWEDATDLNSRSIGIEIVNPGHEFGYRAFPDRQIDAVIALCRSLVSRFAIPAARVLGHSDIAPNRKQDPGELFPWARLAEEGLGIWTRPAPIVAGPVLQLGDRSAGVRELRAEFSRFGYRAGHSDEFDGELEAIVTAFQRHFRPARVDGVADPSTVTTLQRLLSLRQT
jgi:N-acetylmuramoyl-L-alanine amidase